MNLMKSTRCFRLAFLFFLSTLFPIAAFSQQVFERKVTSVGNVGLSITNVGILGKPDIASNPSGDPSFEFPLNSGQEHLFEAGIWIGAYYGGTELRVSTASVTDGSGYATGKGGFEFTNDGTPIIERSSLKTSQLYSPLAISHQDLIASFSDRRTKAGTNTGEIVIQNHINPLFADVTLTSYNWNFSFTESFSILKYTITNTSDQPWDSVYIGMYADLINRNVNSATESGSAFFNKNGYGYLDSLSTIYAFDAGSGDTPRTVTYGGLAIIGTEYKGVNFHPLNTDYLTNNGFRAPRVGPNYWKFGSGAGLDQRPADDVERYSRMTTPYPYDTKVNELSTEGRNSGGNYLSMISIGPFQRLNPGESFSVYFSAIGGLMPADLQSRPSLAIDNTPYSRSLFVENVKWALKTFQGEDKNNNGILDAGEDINGDGKLNRFLIPEPPSVPNLRVELESGKAVLYWDRSAEESIDPISGIKDFEGYKIYKTDLGQDLTGLISSSARPIREYDTPGNSIGFNTGFSEIKLPAAYKFDDGDQTEYWYRYEIEGLLSGWQYQFSVTAFDGGGTTDGSIKLESLESSPNANAIRVFPGTPVNTDFKEPVGVYPNPYRINAAWDGTNALNRKIMFYNLPARSEIRVYTLAGEVVADMKHEASSYKGDTRWFNDFSTTNRKLSGGEYAWDLLSNSRQNLTTGLYLYTVKDLSSGKVQQGKLVIIK